LNLNCKPEQMFKPKTEHCHICKSLDLTLIQCAKGFSSVTSDCKVWEGASNLAICNHCGISQTIADEKWLQDTREIYEDYEIYHQGDSCDHFVVKDGKNTRRSNILVDEIIRKELVGKSGTMLEIGPGGGNLLKVWNDSLDDWRLHAADVNDKAKESILSLKGVKGFYTCNIEEIPHKFDFVVSVHSLEHIPNPFDYLKNLKKIIKREGILLINVPNCEENPFIISVADHCSHFVPDTLSKLVASSGYEVLSLSTEIIDKEIVLFARNDPEAAPNLATLKSTETCSMLSSHLDWLSQILKELRKLDESIKLGCLGTSIAGTWLRAQLGERLQFYVDEDSSRQGNDHLGLPILSAKQVDPEALVFLAFPFPIAMKISRKLQDYDFRILLPPNSFR
jgi:2-polyprenyl-3-methyl-5-hydroxy-6-metoxy-1,4-benzoquinol methylase